MKNDLKSLRTAIKTSRKKRKMKLTEVHVDIVSIIEKLNVPPL
jgi:hypothetical protein